MAKKCDLEGPNESIFKPGNAGSMPTKNYPASSQLPTGKKTNIDGPGKEGKLK